MLRVLVREGVDVEAQDKVSCSVGCNSCLVGAEDLTRCLCCCRMGTRPYFLPLGAATHLLWNAFSTEEPALKRWMW